MEENSKNYVSNEIQGDFSDKLDEPIHKNYLVFKRLADIILATLLFIPSSVIILIFMFLVKIETPGKCFYSQKRVGLMGKTITVTKLRSMYSF